MKIKKSKIRSTNKYISGIKEGSIFYIGLKTIQDFNQRLRRSGIIGELNIGDTFLPIPIGKISKYNADGKFRVRKDKEKETHYRDVDIKDWRGNTHSVSIPYKKYPREPIPPPKIKLIIQEYNKEKIITSPSLINSKGNHKEIKHVINLFLELFGECYVLQENLMPAFKNIQRLNWNILPKGEYPWDRLEAHVTSLIDSYKKTEGNKTVIKNQIKFISDKKPDFVAIGDKGFRGYMIFGFKSKNVYILESIHSGNATYVFGEDWKELSQMTKAQIIDSGKQLDRIIHNNSWKSILTKYIT